MFTPSLQTASTADAAPEGTSEEAAAAAVVPAAAARAGAAAPSPVPGVGGRGGCVKPPGEGSGGGQKKAARTAVGVGTDDEHIGLNGPGTATGEAEGRVAKVSGKEIQRGL